jgi:PAS domain S-box-containing protein
MNVMTQFSAAYDYGRDLAFRAVFEGAAIGIAICQLDGRILEANPALSTIFGCSQNELAGTTAFEFHSELKSELKSALKSEFQSKVESEREAQLRPENGQQNHSGNLSLKEMLDRLIRGEQSSFEFDKHYRRKDKDSSEFWGHLTLSLGCDSRRCPAFLIAMLADVTEHKQIEEHLRVAEKMEAIGRLAGGIAHDFNNLLTGILLYCDLLSAGFTIARLESAELRQYVEEVRRAGEQGAAITQQLLAISRKQASAPRPVALNETVASTQNLLRRLIGEQIEFALLPDSRLDDSTGLVLADPAQVRQILLNLVLNARDAMPQGGKITLSTRVTEFPDGFPANGDGKRKPKSARGRRAVALAVTDNGCGMNRDIRARLFEPFFTTKKPGEGTGLGLATVQRIVNELDGTIKVSSELGQGTCIEVFFPAIQPTGIEPTRIDATGIDPAEIEAAEIEPPAKLSSIAHSKPQNSSSSERRGVDFQAIFRKGSDRTCS